MRILAMATVLALGTAAFGQVAPGQRQDEHATERASGIRDNIDVVSGPNVEQVTGHSAVLRWRTNGVAATRVNYGYDPSVLGLHAYRPGGSTNHEVMLRGLKSHTTYYFEIENKWGKNRLTGTFTTQ